MLNNEVTSICAADIKHFSQQAHRFLSVASVVRDYRDSSIVSLNSGYREQETADVWAGSALAYPLKCQQHLGTDDVYVN
ncbi:hypothetical protein DPMN_124194 [Dreissena polymorpha]|uniref:Uncharacterized protein n=1 Tax=Dreissena polymorpha TaxID=45954 RepID=A0A9D4GVY0_DREPO|nr:hypothetical protein DPMN_124194 [Dreissena polymorpha]